MLENKFSVFLGEKYQSNEIATAAASVEYVYLVIIDEFLPGVSLVN